MNEILEINPIVYVIFFCIIYAIGTKPKQGGLVTAVRQQTFWLICLTVFFILFALKIYFIKKNYTELHRQVETNKFNIKYIKSELNIK